MNRFEIESDERKTWEDGYRYETRYIGRDENTPLPTWASHFEPHSPNEVLYVNPYLRQWS